MKIKEYFYGKENIILILLSLGLISLTVRDIPFLNIIFPNYATISVLFLTAIYLLKWYKKYIFYILLTIVTVISYFAGSIAQAEQLGILVFVVLTINIIDQTIQLFKNESK